MPGSTERDRQHEVMRLLEEAARVSVPDLAERFGVSLVTPAVLVHTVGVDAQQETVPSAHGGSPPGVGGRINLSSQFGGPDRLN